MIVGALFTSEKTRAQDDKIKQGILEFFPSLFWRHTKKIRYESSSSPFFVIPSFLLLPFNRHQGVLGPLCLLLPYFR